MPDPKKNLNNVQLYPIDPDSYEPVYVQLVKIIKRHIAEGLFLSGDRLPPESEFCSQFKVSPMTVRRAIKILADEGIVTTKKGRGTFVNHLKLGTARFQLQDMQELMGDPSLTDVELLGVNVVKADKNVADKLKQSKGNKVIYIRRLLCINDEPAFYHREYIVYDPKRPIIEAEMEFTSLEGLFSGTGTGIFKVGEITIAASLMDEEEAQVLKIKTPAAALSLTHIFYDYNDRPISWGWFICRSDQLNFKTKVGIQ